MVRKTRKTPVKTPVKTAVKSVQDKALTIPELRKAFEHIDGMVHSKLAKMEESESVPAFRKEWKRIFGKEVSEESAKEYLNFVLSEKRGAVSKGGQHGGGAPLGWDMTPGAGAVRALTYISDGFGFANKDSIVAECGKFDSTPHLLPGMGDRTVKFGGSRQTKKQRSTRRKSKQGGGGLGSTLMEAVTRPFLPTGQAYDAMLIGKGVNTLSSPRPEIPAFSTSQNTTVYSASSTPTSRTF